MNNSIKKIIIILLQFVSRLILTRHKPFVIAVTGSVGKTTTKDIVYHGISPFLHTAKAQKSLNTDFGVPLSIIMEENPWGNIPKWFVVIWKGFLTIFKNNYPKFLVLEVGTRYFGDIARIAKWVKPDISIITHIPDVPPHIEFFGTREAIIDEKSDLIRFSKKNSWVVLNRDNDDVYEIAKNCMRKIVSVGFNEQADVFCGEYRIVTFDSGQYGLSFDLTVGDFKREVIVPGFIAKHQIYGVLFLVGVAKILELDLNKVCDSLSNLETSKGRLNPLVGINSSIILDDSYNASPSSMRAGIETLVSIKGNRKIAVLGDMLELGKFTKTAHEDIGLFVKESKLDHVIFIGPRMRYAYDMLLSKKYPKTKFSYFENLNDVVEPLVKIIKPNDVVYVKGSQGMRLERLVYEILEYKDTAEDVLTRQDLEWKKR